MFEEQDEKTETLPKEKTRERKKTSRETPSNPEAFNAARSLGSLSNRRKKEKKQEKKTSSQQKAACVLESFPLVM